MNLELEGFDVVEAGTLAAAQSMLREVPFDAVLLDVHLGDDDGLALLPELRRERPSAKVALFTGSAEVDQETRMTADAVLAKPFSLEDLTATAHRLVNGKGD